MLKRWETVRKHWLNGWARRSGERVDLERAADAMLTSGALPDELDVDVFGAAERMLHGGGSIVTAVNARFGPANALRVKLRSLDWSVASGREQQTWWWMLADAKASLPAVVDDGWKAVRIGCSVADADRYVEAREIAGTVRAARPEPITRVPIDFAFPSEQSWSAEDMRAILASADFAKVTYRAAPLFASLVDEAAIVAFLQKCTPRQSILTLRYACDLVAALPVDTATRVLLGQTDVALSSRHYDPTELVNLASALTSVVTESMALGLVRHLRHPRFSRYLVPYFENHAESGAARARERRASQERRRRRGAPSHRRARAGVPARLGSDDGRPHV